MAGAGAGVLPSPLSVGSGHGERRPWLSGMALVALLVGLLIGASVVVMSSPAFHRLVASTPSGSPPFNFDVNLTNASRSHGTYVYNFSITFYPVVNVSTNWTQFFVYDPSFQKVNVTVTVIDTTGSPVALFNSSQSAWRGVASGINQSFPSMGGWVYGYGAPVAQNDTLQVAASGSLADCLMDVGVAVTTQPHHGAGILTVGF